MAIAELVTRNFRYEYVRVGDLKVDPMYHAPERYNPRRVAQMAADFDETKLGVITVSMRGGVLFLIDGNHRRGAASTVGLTHLYAKVYLDLTQQQEAAIFIGLSDAVRLSPIDLWQARRVDGDPIVLGVEAILEKHGMRVVRGGNSAHANTTRSVSALERIYNADPVLLDETLRIVRHAWFDMPRSTDNRIILGLASFLFCYSRTNPRAKVARLVDRLTQITPEEVIRAETIARSVSEGRYTTGLAVSGGQTKSGIVGALYPRRAFLSIYNRGLRAKLPDLSLSDLRAINDGRIADLTDRV